MQTVITPVLSNISSIFWPDGADKPLYFTFHFIDALTQQSSCWFIDFKVNLSTLCLTDSGTLGGKRREVVDTLWWKKKKKWFISCCSPFNDISRTAMWLKAEAAFMWSKTCLCALLLQRIIDLNRRGPVPFRMSSSQQSVSKCKTLEKAAVNGANTKQSSRGFCNRFQAWTIKLYSLPVSMGFLNLKI